MTAELFESVARIARHEVYARGVAGIGRVVDSFPAGPGAAPPDHAVSVEMRDSGLILPRVPVSVGAMGFAAIPNVDDLVLVVFADGDYNAPVVAGRLYHAELDPPEHEAGQVVLRLPPGQAEGDLNLVVDGESPSAMLTLPQDVLLEISSGNVEIAVGEVKVVLTGSGGGQAEVSAGSSKITLKKDGDIELSAAANLSIKAQGNLKLQGNQVEIKGLSQVALSGAQVKIN